MIAGATGADVIGLDWTVDMADARQRLGSKSVQVCEEMNGLGTKQFPCMRHDANDQPKVLLSCSSASSAVQSVEAIICLLVPLLHLVVMYLPCFGAC